MKKYSTQTIGQTAKRSTGRRTTNPSDSTIAFLRQFARVYCPVGNGVLPGIVLN